MPRPSTRPSPSVHRRIDRSSVRTSPYRRERHHGGQRQVELEVQQHEHDEGRGGEEEGGEQARVGVEEPATEAVDGERAEDEEGPDHGLGGQWNDGQGEVEEPGRARHDRRVEARLADDLLQPVAPGLREAPVTGDGALEMVGVIPFGRAAIDREPDDHDRGQPDQQTSQREPVPAGHESGPMTVRRGPGVSSRSARGPRRAPGAPPGARPSRWASGARDRWPGAAPGASGCAAPGCRAARSSS